MTRCDVLVVGGTHGNEINGAWLVDQWREQPDLLETAGLSLALEIGNPEARAVNRRYVDRDLNRCFTPDRLNQGGQEQELQRARQLLALHGPASATPCRVALDLHSTTAAMGSCLVVYGRRPADLALAARVQGALGLPVYLHEADAAQTGFLVEQWPCGLVIEVGPVPQGVLDARVVRQTRIALETCLQQLAAARAGHGRDPHSLVVHRHLGSVDLPRDSRDRAAALVHQHLQGQDWQPLMDGAVVFESPKGEALSLQQDHGEAWPVFINEAAYAEKRIAFSLTRREVWSTDPSWGKALEQLMT